MRGNILVFILVISFFGCSYKPKINLNETPPKQVPIKQRAMPKQKKGSLYTRSGGSLFADKKDLQIGDIIQINIEEILKRDSKNQKQLTKDSSTSLGGALITPIKDSKLNTTSGMNRFNKNLGFNLNSQTKNSFKGSANTKNDEAFRTTVSAIITDIYKNGNYFIKGSKEILINGNKQIIAISGVIRPYDITPENSINSNQIANLKIYYKKIGVEQENLEKPWGSRLLEKIWPF